MSEYIVDFDSAEKRLVELAELASKGTVVIIVMEDGTRLKLFAKKYSK
jgi:hypothetical protein